ncbi:MAG: SBBP repeat-containing protein [Bryobacteraceae bacterium]
MRFVVLFSFLAGALCGEGLPLAFLPNAGQFDPAVRFLVQTPDVRAAFLADGARFQAGESSLQVRFAGASSAVRLEGAGPLGGRANFFIGNDPAKWRSGLAMFDHLVYHGLYPGIDGSYAGLGRLLKSEFVIQPGADPHLIRMEYPGASAVWVDSGELRVKVGAMEFREWAPEVYQTARDGSRTTVKAKYAVFEDNSVGFELDDYDKALPLVIDPVITYSTYLGGSGMGAVTSVARDGLGNLYAAGWTESLDFPIAGALQAVNRGGVDAFIVKFDPTGASLMYATYIGGNGDDRAAGIAVDSLGQAHVAGATGSSNFPLQAPARSSFVGGKEGFVLKLNAAGSALVYSTYLGGANYDVATAIAVDASGFAYIAGDTLSADFPLLSPTQATFGGQNDAFVVKLDALGVRVFSTFLGGAQSEHAGGIATDGAGIVYLAGGTLSTNLPVVAATQSSNAGGQDAFIAKIKTTPTTQLLYSTYLGGSGGSLTAPEQANAIALDASGNAYVAGVASSTNFPVTAGTLQTNAGGSRDVFVTKLNSAGTARLYSTYLGWTGFDWASGIAVDSSGNAYVAGYTSSVSFANVGGVQTGFKGLYDGFVANLNATGNALSFSTLYGGAGSDQINAIAVDPNGNMFIGGQTSSYDLPAQSAYQSSNVSGNTGWVARLGMALPPDVTPTVVSANVVYGSGGAATVTAQFSHPSGAASLTNVAVLLSRTASIDFACDVSYDRVTNILTLANNVLASGGTNLTPGSGTAQNTQCQLNGAGSGAVLVGNTLTLTLSLVLDVGFPGNNTVYLYASDVNVNTGWLPRPVSPRYPPIRFRRAPAAVRHRYLPSYSQIRRPPRTSRRLR